MTQPNLATCIASGLVTFYDDRGKVDEDLTATEVLFEDNDIALVVAKFSPEQSAYKVLFNKSSGEVLTSEFEFWRSSYPADRP